MRVLVVGPLPRLGALNRLPWLNHTASALRRLGHVVTVAGYRESWAASPAVNSRAGRLPGAVRALARFATEMDARRDRHVIAAARRIRPELTIMLKGEVFSDETVAAVKQASAGPMVTWWGDDPFVFPASVRRFRLFDRVFVFDRAYLPELAALGVTHAAFLPAACDETIFRPMTLSGAERRRFGAEVSFVATYDPLRGALVRALADAAIDVGVWGTGWRGAVEVGCSNGRLVRGGVVSDRGAAKIYNASKIGLNLHHRQTRVAGINLRTLELLAAGTLPLMDRIKGIEELLEPGRDVVCYGSTEEAVDLANRYLKDSAARAAIVARGRARVLAEHTYVARLDTLCRVARG